MKNPTNTLPTTATQHELPNGRYEYRLDDEIILKGSKADYVAFTLWQTDELNGGFAWSGHRSLEAAYSARQSPANKYLKTKLAVLEVSQR